VRLLLAAAAGAALLGLLWLLLAPGERQMVPVDTGQLSDLQVAAARGILAERGIPAKMASGRLLAQRRYLPQAKDVINELRSSKTGVADLFASLAADDNILRTSAQDDKRWQAAKMAALSKLVEMLPSVASATVIYDPGSPHGLGGAKYEPTAAVNVKMKPGAVMTRSLALAIADQVSGSIAGMSSQDVRVIDGSGQSYRFDDTASPAEEELRRRRATEEYYQEKVRLALAYIDKAVVGVSLAESGGPQEPLIVSVAVPRSYLAAAVSVAGPKAEWASDDPSSPADHVLAKVRQAAAASLGDRQSRVQADWYYDSPSGDLAAAAPAPAQGSHAWLATAVVIAAVSAGAGGAASWAAARYRRRRRQNDALATQKAEEGSQPPTASPQEPPAGNEGLFAFLGELCADEIASLVSLEHPQAVAIVLGQLSAAKAAAVLGALSEEMQAAVATRVAALDQVDPLVAAEVARSLAERVRSQRQSGPAAAGGQARMAQILRHAGYATEKTILAALAGQSPTLADAVRRQMFAFDDMVQLPAERLWPGLSTVDSGELAVALRTAAEEVKQKVLSAMPADAADRVKREMDRIGPVRLIEVEAAQQRVAEAVRRSESGEYLSESQRTERQLLA